MMYVNAGEWPYAPIIGLLITSVHGALLLRQYQTLTLHCDIEVCFDGAVDPACIGSLVAIKPRYFCMQSFDVKPAPINLEYLYVSHRSVAILAPSTAAAGRDSRFYQDLFDQSSCVASDKTQFVHVCATELLDCCIWPNAKQLTYQWCGSIDLEQTHIDAVLPTLRCPCVTGQCRHAQQASQPATTTRVLFGDTRWPMLLFTISARRLHARYCQHCCCFATTSVA
jgi:hypothetical protein